MATALEIKNLHAWYGESHILHGVDLHVNQGEVVTLLGRNGAGRTTTLRAVMGLTGARKGSIQVNGTETQTLPLFGNRLVDMSWSPDGSTLAVSVANVSDYSGLTLASKLYFVTWPASLDKVLEMTDEAAIERHVWSPDGKTIAFISDRSGEFEIWTIAQDGSSEPVQITKKADTYYYSIEWSPDSKRISFTDNGRNL